MGSGYALDFLNTLLGAFLGFLSAMLLENRSERKEKERKYRLILRSIYGELKDIVESLEQYVAHGAALRHRIATPSWDAMQNSGLALDLIEKRYYDDLIKTYSLIKAHNEDRTSNADADNLEVITDVVQYARAVLRAVESEVDVNGAEDT